MSEAYVPENLPTGEELAVSPGEGRNIHAMLAAQALVNSEGLSLVPDTGRDVAAMNRAEDIVSGRMERAIPNEDPVGAAIDAEVAKINRLVSEPPSLPLGAVGVDFNKVHPEIKEKIAGYPSPAPDPTAAAMSFIRDERLRAGSNTEKSSLTSRVGNFLGGVAGKAGDALVKMGGDIEAAELDRAEKERWERMTHSERSAERLSAMERWATVPPSPNASVPSEAGVPQEKPPRPVPIIRESVPQTPPPSGPAEKRAREAWGMDTFESSVAMESAEALSLLAREIQLQEEELKIQEEELALRRKKLLLLQKKRAFEESRKKGQPPVPPKGPGVALRSL